MERAELLKKLQELERQVDALKDEFPRPRTLKRAFLKGKWVLDGLVAYWIVLALVVGVIVNRSYNVAVFESIKNIGVNNTSSDYYYRVGETLMEHAQFDAAGEAFTQALAINPSNAPARQALLKVKAFEPVADSGEPNLLVVENRLRGLRDAGIFGEDDYLLLYLRGLLKRRQSAVQTVGTEDSNFAAAKALLLGPPEQESARAHFKPVDLKPLGDYLSTMGSDFEQAKQLFLKSISVKRTFIGSHFELGNTYLDAGDVDGAIRKYHDALNLDRRFAPALNGLGYCQLVLATLVKDEQTRAEDIETARDTLEAANGILTRPETSLNIGDTFLFDTGAKSNFLSAISAYESALDSLAKLGAAPAKADDADKSPDKARPRWELFFVFLPESTDIETCARIDTGGADKRPCRVARCSIYANADCHRCRRRGSALLLSEPSELKAMILYSLGIASAMQGDEPTSEKHFSDAEALNCRVCSALAENKIQVLLDFLGSGTKAQTGLQNRTLLARLSEKHGMPVRTARQPSVVRFLEDEPCT